MENLADQNRFWLAKCRIELDQKMANSKLLLLALHVSYILTTMFKILVAKSLLKMYDKNEQILCKHSRFVHAMYVYTHISMYCNFI